MKVCEICGKPSAGQIKLAGVRDPYVLCSRHIQRVKNYDAKFWYREDLPHKISQWTQDYLRKAREKGDELW